MFKIKEWLNILRNLLVILLVLLSFETSPLAKSRPKRQRSIPPLTLQITGHLQHDIDHLLEHLLFKETIWGIAILCLDDTSLIYTRNPDRAFVPASNVKLFTTAIALAKLGPAYQYQTKIFQMGTVDSFGWLKGSLIIKGGGDPTFDDPSPLESWADSLVQKGISCIQGDIIGDACALLNGVNPPWPDKEKKKIVSQISSLSFANNEIKITLTPGEKLGAPLLVKIQPERDYFIVNQTKTVKTRYGYCRISARSGKRFSRKRRVSLNEAISLAIHGDTIYVKGTLGKNRQSRTFRLSAPDPGKHFAGVLKRILEKKGILISGKALGIGEAMFSKSQKINPQPLFVWHSLPLQELVKVVNKRSDNIYAEYLFNTLGAEITQEASHQGGMGVQQEFLLETNLGECRLVDGSGLSKENEVTPRQIVNLLQYIYQQPYAETFYNSLPIAGIDGTLGQRMQNEEVRGRVYAKTGTLNGVSALSGYLRAKNGKTYAFAIIGNHIKRKKLAEKVEDYICQLLIESSG
ncbi:MAG: D-alanyl-D-alanine carboxypeptidase/D-alanyl-D-alanine-endopeptidase [Candidatus Edwardsbacteria bacterium]